MGNVLIGIGGAFTLGFVAFKVKKPFKTHKLNTFAHIILLLLIYSLISKPYMLTVLVRIFYFFIDVPNTSARLAAFLMTYPSINMVICSYLLSNKW